jgi:hypothetical protein
MLERRKGKAERRRAMRGGEVPADRASTGGASSGGN